jgi:hypothetical protein
MLLQFGEKNPGMTRVMVGDALVFENDRLQARMNQFFDKIESQLRQCLRGRGRSGWLGDTPTVDANAQASVLTAFAVGRLQRYARSGFKRQPTEHLDAALQNRAATTTPDPTMSTRTPRKPPSKTTTAKRSKAAKPRLSRTRRPPDIELADWQTALRRQFGREQPFGLENLGQRPRCSRTSACSNPESGIQLPRGDSWAGAWAEFLHLPRLRDQRSGHLQAHRIHARQAGEAKRGGKAALARGYPA